MAPGSWIALACAPASVSASADRQRGFSAPAVACPGRHGVHGHSAQDDGDPMTHEAPVLAFQPELAHACRSRKACSWNTALLRMTIVPS